ncbi:MAG: hypothetical protein R3D67_12250 [Hyphomicrobiaceae bacterium]
MIAKPTATVAADGATQERVSAESRQRAEDLAAGGRRRYDAILGQKRDMSTNGAATAAASDTSASRLAQAATMDHEAGVDWLVRAKRGYGDVIRRLSQPTAPNPVADAVHRRNVERRGEPAASTATPSAKPRVLPPLAVTASEPGSPNDGAGVASVVDTAKDLVKETKEAFQKEIVGALATGPSAPAPSATDPSPKSSENTIPQANAQPPAPPAAPSGGVLDDTVAAINKANREFQQTVVGRLSTPAPAATDAPPALATTTASRDPPPPPRADQTATAVSPLQPKGAVVPDSETARKAREDMAVSG